MYYYVIVRMKTNENFVWLDNYDYLISVSYTKVIHNYMFAYTIILNEKGKHFSVVISCSFNVFISHNKDREKN